MSENRQPLSGCGDNWMGDPSRPRHLLPRGAGPRPRFDGWFFTAVRTTGIYCRPSCPAITPQRRNVTFHPERRRRAAGRLPRLQAVPPGRLARIAGVGLARRSGRPGAAPHRRRRDRPGRRARAGPPARLLRAAGEPHADRRGRRRPAGARPSPARADRPHAAGDHRPAGRRRRVRRRVRECAPVQRHRAGRLRDHAEPTAGQPAGPAAVRAGAGTIRCGCRTASRWISRRRSTSSAPARSPGVEAVRRRLVHPGAARARRAGAGSMRSAADGAVTCRVAPHRPPRPRPVVSRVRRLLDLDADPVGGRRRARRATRRWPRWSRQAPGPALPRRGGRLRDRRSRRRRAADLGRRRAHRCSAGSSPSTGEAAFDGEPFRLFPGAEEFAAIDPAQLPMPRARARDSARAGRGVRVDGG